MIEKKSNWIIGEINNMTPKGRRQKIKKVGKYVCFKSMARFLQIIKTIILRVD